MRLLLGLGQLRAQRLGLRARLLELAVELGGALSRGRRHLRLLLGVAQVGAQRLGLVRVSSSSLRAAASASLVAAQLDRLLLEPVLGVARRGQRLCGGRGLRVALDQLRLQRGHPLLGGAGQLCAIAHRRELALQLGRAHARGVRLLAGLREIADHGRSGRLALLELRLGRLDAAPGRARARPRRPRLPRSPARPARRRAASSSAMRSSAASAAAARTARRGQLPLEILEQRACLVALRLRGSRAAAAIVEAAAACSRSRATSA